MNPEMEARILALWSTSRLLVLDEETSQIIDRAAFGTFDQIDSAEIHRLAMMSLDDPLSIIRVAARDEKYARVVSLLAGIGALAVEAWRRQKPKPFAGGL